MAETGRLGSQSPLIAQPQRPAVRAWILSAVATLVATPLSVFVLDRPLAAIAHDDLHPGLKIFAEMTHLVDPLPVLAALGLVWSVIQVARGARFSGFEQGWLRVSIAVTGAILVKDQLKYAFGRTWPETWTQNNPSWFGNGTYGFFPFHGGAGWYSFPSGHTTLICSAMAALWICWPRGRIVYALAIAIVVIGLIGADYHWLSDIFAGAALGSAAGIAAARFGTAARPKE